MSKYLPERSASSISPDEAQAWIDSLITPQRSAHTVAKTWVTAARTVFRWAKQRRLISRNVFAEVTVTVPRRVRNRPSKAFQTSEIEAILRAASAVGELKRRDDAAKRWVPWLQAYTGARAGEITQLRKEDVLEKDGIVALVLKPEAGTIKGGKAREVPLHEHLVSQGFLTFVGKRSDGPLFFDPSKGTRTPTTAKNQPKPRPTQVRQRVAAWVRTLGVDDREAAPTHGWRHTFKQVADRVGITEKVSDAITGPPRRL